MNAAWHHAAALQPQAPGGRSTGSDAEFLIQATFGPTRESLRELAGLSYEGWVAQQMALPLESHRSYFRERANPRQVTPLAAGLVRPRCAEGSRWHRFAVERDDLNKRLEVRGGQLRVDGELRAEIDPNFAGNGLQRPARCTNVPLASWRNAQGVLWRNCPEVSAWECSNQPFAQQGACVQSCFNAASPVDDTDCSTGWVNLTYEGFVCDVVDAVGGVMQLSSEANCKGTLLVMRNPAVWLSRPPSSTVTQRNFLGMRAGVLLLSEPPANCDLGDIAQVSAGQFARYSARLELLQNTPDAPAAVPGTAATLCPTVRRNPFNMGSCRVQQACEPGWTPKVSVVLTPENLRRLSNVSGSMVHSVAGLRATQPPCRQPSRWAALDCQGLDSGRCTASALSAAQVQALQAALRAASGGLRDVTAACDGVPTGAVVQLDAAFFQQVHPDEGNAYDFSDWSKRDPASAAEILRFASGSALRFPASFDQSRWTAMASQLAPALVGTLGRTVDFMDLPDGLQLPAVADAFQGKPPVHYEVCGSPGEVANEPSQGHWYQFLAHGTDKLAWRDQDYELPYGRPVRLSRVNVWFQKAMHGKDQLRQRMAWALSQIFVHGDDGKGLVECKLAFYDVFVRNAFGSFRDLLREVTYSPMMGHYLTFAGNKAFHVQGTYPDENYAREIMQLFSIGLWQLHPNGGRLRAAGGEALPTYTNLHIQNFARVFTGFSYERSRGNTEHFYGLNLIDPMFMVAEHHDSLPKADLGDGYLGDGYPLCRDLPGNVFLRQGARFEFAGFQRPRWSQDREIFRVNATSALHRALCQPTTPEAPASTPCKFQTVVELQRTVACAGEQCAWQLPRFLLVGDGYYEFVPPPCVHIFFQQCWGQRWSANTCRLTVAIDAEGLVTPQPDAPSTAPRFLGRFPVHWSEAFATPSASSCPDVGCVFANSTCICNAVVETVAAFQELPSKENVSSLRIGAFPPASPCTFCSGPVRAYSASGRIDNGTIFEVDGRFWRNLRSTVRVGRRHTFRNPPNFMTQGATRPREALNEVEAFLDLLVHHPTTPVFTSYRLIQRFGNSNPSARYLEDVVRAFRTGSYAGRTYSGRYGDLGATLAAILLHPEARASVALQAGALREPVLKLVHVLRSLEYSDRFGRPMLLSDNLADAGEEPLLAPTVFNFYHFNFQPSAFLANGTLRTFVAPESQIMDSTQLLTSMNGLLSTANNGGLSHCDGGFGAPFPGTSSLPRLTAVCQQGDFLAMGRLNASTADAALSELSLLLTGSRLSPSSSATVRAFAQGPVWVKAPAATARLAAAQAAIMLSPEFNSVGGSVGSRPLPTPTSTPAPMTTTARPSRPYKALVQLYLDGGADTFQLIVPQNCPLYDEYKSVRSSIALAPSQLLRVSAANQSCKEFGIHNKLPFLAELYRGGEAAFVSNVGNLAEPLASRQEFFTGGKRRCAGMFSHEDQSKGAQTLLCQSSGASAQLGAGGRLADALATGTEKYRTASFSVAGNAAWSDGYEVKPSSLSATHGVVRISDLTSLRSVVGNITNRAYEGIYGDIYVRGLADTIRQTEEMGRILDGVQLKTDFPKATLLQRQLLQVARVIASRAERRVDRDLFFVRIGAFDTHKTVNPSLDRLFSDVNGALTAFVTELKAQGSWDSTVLFTASDFGRTLTPNEDDAAEAGTDHGWAGNHVVMGGTVRGGRMLNDFPSTLQPGSLMDVGRGRLIPKYPLESYMVPIWQWMGLDDSKLGEAFPNLGSFNRSAHILALGSVFEG